MFKKIYDFLFNRKNIKALSYPNKYDGNREDRLTNINGIITDSISRKPHALACGMN